MAIKIPFINPNEGDFDTVSANPLGRLIATLWQTMVVLGGLLVLMNLVWGAFNWISASGDEKKIEDARNKITHAVIGMTILAASYAIMKFLEGVFGFSLININWDQIAGGSATP